MADYAVNEYIKWLDTRDDVNRLIPNAAVHNLYNKYRNNEATDEEIAILNQLAINYIGQPAMYNEFVEEMFINPKRLIVCYVGKTPYSDFGMALSDADGKYTITLAADVNEVTLTEFDTMCSEETLETDSLYRITPDEDNYIYVPDDDSWYTPTVYRGTAEEIEQMAGSYSTGAVYIDTDNDITYIAADADNLSAMDVNTTDYYSFVTEHDASTLYFIEDDNIYITTSDQDFEPYKNDNSSDEPLADDPLVVEGDYIEVTQADVVALVDKGELETDAVYHITGTETYYIATSSNTYEPYTPKPKE